MFFFPCLACIFVSQGVHLAYKKNKEDHEYRGTLNLSKCECIEVQQDKKGAFIFGVQLVGGKDSDTKARFLLKAPSEDIARGWLDGIKNNQQVYSRMRARRSSSISTPLVQRRETRVEDPPTPSKRLEFEPAAEIKEEEPEKESANIANNSPKYQNQTLGVVSGTPKNTASATSSLTLLGLVRALRARFRLSNPFVVVALLPFLYFVFPRCRTLIVRLLAAFAVKQPETRNN